MRVSWAAIPPHDAIISFTTASYEPLTPDPYLAVEVPGAGNAAALESGDP